MNPVALLKFLEPFDFYFAKHGVTEICINKPCELWVEQQSKFSYYKDETLTRGFLWQFACLVAEYNQREISPQNPILSAVLPNGARVQFVIEPACEKGSFVCSIRKVSAEKVPLEQYFTMYLGSKSESSLLQLYEDKQYTEFLREAVLQHKNIIISGGTSTGKTTFLNALLRHVPLKERIITIETDREVRSDHPNVAHLLAAEEGKSVTNITMLDLLKASLRLRPDRILVSELRAQEAFPYLRAINSGHPGSMTTLHANSPEGCFEQLAMMVMQGGTRLSREEIITYAKSIVDVVVQITRSEEGVRHVSEIYFKDTRVESTPK